LIKRETVLLLKERYVTVGFVGQNMLFPIFRISIL